jgi:phage shock protein C
MQHHNHREGGDLRRDKLYRNSEDGLIAGVCAGLADFFGFDLTLTRVLVVIGAFLFPTLIVVYVILAILVKKRPGAPRRSTPMDEDLQRQVRAEPHATLSTVRHRFRELDLRLQRLEKYVTSKRFRLDREFEGLKD